MATLDKHLEDEEYRHWVKAALCLQYTKDGLVPLADQKSQELHSDVLKQLQDNGNQSVHGICPNPRINFKMGVIQCCTYCQGYIDEASKHFTGSGALLLKNSDITNLPKQHWQIAKLFMNAGQDVSNTDPSQTDISGILNFIDHCDLAKAAIKNTNYVTQVRDTRNWILHKADMKITKHDFSTKITPALIDLLQDPLYLLNNKAAQDAVIKIIEVESSSFHISKGDESQALNDMFADQNKCIQGLGESLLDLETKMNDSEKTTRQKISEVHRDLSTELEGQKTDIRKVQGPIDCLMKIKKDVNDLRDLMKKQGTEMQEIPLNDLRFQMQSLHQELEAISKRMDNLEQNLQEPSLPESEKDELELQQYLRDGYKQSRLQVPTLPDCYTLPVSKIFAPVVILKKNKSGLKASGALEQNKQDPNMHGKDELELQQYLRDGYKQSRLQVPTLSDCYTLSVSKISAPEVILKTNKSGLKAPGALEQNKQDPNIHGKGEKQDQKIRSYKTMFYENGILQKHNFLLGKAGVGKTTLSKHLVDIWCNASQSPYYDDAGWLEQFKFVFHVECRHASESESVFDMICNQLIDRDSLKIVAKRVLSTKPDECLVIADGLDEWKGSPTQLAKTSYDIPGLPSTIYLHECVMLTTSRPWRVHALSQRFEQTGRVLELQGIDNVKTLTTTILTELPVANPEQACQAFLKSVKASNMDELIQIPLMLINVLTIWRTNKSLNPSICINYSYMVEDFIKRARGESRRYGDMNRLTEAPVIGLSGQESNWADSAHLLPDCFRSTDFCKGYAGLIINLGHLAFDMLVREKHEQSLVFSTQETMSYLNEKELEVCLTTGILSQSQAPGRGIQKMDKFCFCHKTFQEFLGSLWLSIKYLENRYRFHECCKTLDDVFDYSVFVKFLCGFSPSAGKMFWQFIVNEVIEKDANIQKMRLKDIVASGEDSIRKLDLLVLACTEEARQSYQENQKLYYFIPDLCFDIHVTEQQHTFLYDLLHENIENIKSVEVCGKERCLQIVASVNKMTEIVCISLCSEKRYSCSDFRPVLSSGSKESPMLELPQQIRSLCLEGWTIKGLGNDLPMHLTALTFAKLTMPHSLIESLSRCLRTSSSLLYLHLSDLDCTDHHRKCCSIVLDLQRHHRLEELELWHLSVEDFLLPHHQETKLRRLVLIGLTLSEQSKDQMSISLTACRDLQELEICYCLSGGSYLPPLDFQRHHGLKLLEIDGSIVKDLLLPTDLPEDADVRVLVLTKVTLTHQSLEQLNSYLAACSTLHELTLNGLSCIDHGERCCLQAIALAIQKHHSLRKLKLANLSCEVIWRSVMLHVQPEPCLRNMTLHELTLTHDGIQQLCRWLAEYSGLEQLELNTLSCSDHNERGCLTELDLQKHHSLRELTLEKLSVGSVILPVQPETCLRDMSLHELTLTHNDIQELCTCSAEYSGLKQLKLNTISCSDHSESCCLIELDLQKHRSLQKLTLEKLSVGSVMLPVQPEPCLRNMKLLELTLTHHGIQQMCRWLVEYSGLEQLELNTLSCSNHSERVCLTELDLQKHHSLRKLTLAKLSVGSLMLPVQPETCLRIMELHELTLTHHGIEQLCRCLAAYSDLLILELYNISCSNHGKRGCLTELDLQKYRRLRWLKLEKLSVGSVILPAQPETRLVTMTLHELTLTHHGIEQLGRCIAEYSDLLSLELNTLSCSDHGERGCPTELDLQKHHSLRELTLAKLSVGSLMLPVQPETCLRIMELHELTLTHHGIQPLCSWLAEYSGLKWLELNTICCSDHGERCLSILVLQIRVVECDLRIHSVETLLDSDSDKG